MVNGNIEGVTISYYEVRKHISPYLMEQEVKFQLYSLKWQKVINIGAENRYREGKAGWGSENPNSHNGKSVDNTKNEYFNKYAVNILLRDMEV